MNGLPDRSFVTLCELVTWLAYGKAIDSATFLAEAQANAEITEDLLKLDMISAAGHNVPETQIAALRQRVAEIEKRDSLIDAAGRAVIHAIGAGRLGPLGRLSDDTGVPQPFPDRYFLRPMVCKPHLDTFYLDETNTDFSTWSAWRNETPWRYVVFRASEVRAIDRKAEISGKSMDTQAANQASRVMRRTRRRGRGKPKYWPTLIRCIAFLDSSGKLHDRPLKEVTDECRKYFQSQATHLMSLLPKSRQGWEKAVQAAILDPASQPNRNYTQK